MEPLPELYREVVSPTVWKQLSQLMQLPALSGFRLAGGTALALYRGHRVSVLAKSAKITMILPNCCRKLRLRFGLLSFKKSTLTTKLEQWLIIC